MASRSIFSFPHNVHDRFLFPRFGNGVYIDLHVAIVPSTSCPGRVAQWRSCRTHGLLVVNSRRGFLPAYFSLSPLLKHFRKVVSGFGMKVVLVDLLL